MERAELVQGVTAAAQDLGGALAQDEDIRRLVGLEASTDGARGSEADALRAEVERLRREIDELKSPATLSPPGGVSTLVGMGFDRAQAEHALSVARGDVSAALDALLAATTPDVAPEPKIASPEPEPLRRRRSTADSEAYGESGDFRTLGPDDEEDEYLEAAFAGDQDLSPGEKAALGLGAVVALGVGGALLASRAVALGALAVAAAGGLLLLDGLEADSAAAASRADSESDSDRTTFKKHDARAAHKS